jgi:hypothetical protein
MVHLYLTQNFHNVCKIYYLSRNTDLCLAFTSISLTLLQSSTTVFITEKVLNQDQASHLSNRSRNMVIHIENFKFRTFSKAYWVQKRFLADTRWNTVNTKVFQEIKVFFDNYSVHISTYKANTGWWKLIFMCHIKYISAAQGHYPLNCTSIIQTGQ